MLNIRSKINDHNQENTASLQNHKKHAMALLKKIDQ